MTRNLPVCEKCNTPVRVVPTYDQPELDEWYCDNPTCERQGHDQGPRLRNRDYNEQSFFIANDGAVEVEVFQRGRELTGEGNVPYVARILESWYGSGVRCEPRKNNARNEEGVDAILIYSNGVDREVQVVRAADEGFCAEIGSNREGTQRVTLAQVADRVGNAIQRKTERTPPSLQEHRILAVDVLSYNFAMYFASRRLPRSWSSVQTQAVQTDWFDVVIVGPNKSWSLKRDGGNSKGSGV